uniref:Carboxylic ester hydrolase n=1 Tax=Panagrolaimus sp. ES5 TaxID=591445 RepID=A0AC34FSA9_9BILA
MWFKPPKNPLLPPEVQTEYGRICGKNFILPDGKITNVFLGIPYAKPPVEDLRFEKPQPPEPWKECLNATKYKSRSIQKDFIWDFLELKVGKSEDCLYLNIMTPEICDSKKYAVMVYIHGGGYVMDSAVKYHYTKICRLGFLGFFTTDDEISVGNYGIWDQYMALKFVKDNIANFGGDPNNITVLGQSAGAVSVDLLSLSPFSRGSFV